MAIQLATTTRNARLDAIEVALGATPTLEIRTGAQPVDCATASSGTVLATISLPDPAFSAASGGAMAKTGTWEDTAADGDGTAGHFRIFNGANCILQGSVGQGTGDLQVDNTSFATGQQFTITSFTLTDGNA